MPHLDHDSHSLDAKYPSIVAPDDYWQEDVVDDSEDGILKAGERAAEEIREAMQNGGRRRRVSVDMVGLVGESGAGSTTHTEPTGWSNPESQQRESRLVRSVPVGYRGGCGGMGRGGLGGEGTEDAEQQEEPELGSTWSSAANTFRRRSVKSSYRLGIRPCCYNCYNYHHSCNRDDNYDGNDGGDRDDGSRGCDESSCECLASRSVCAFYFGSSVKLTFSDTFSFSDHIHRL